jgi:hypothetical protein
VAKRPQGLTGVLKRPKISNAKKEISNATVTVNDVFRGIYSYFTVNISILKRYRVPAKESLQYLGFILFSMNHTFTSMIHTRKV